MNWREIKNAIYNLIALSLTRTNPYFISDTTAYTFDNVYAFYAVTDCAFTTLTTNVEGSDLSAATITAGSIIYMKVSEVQLASGSCILYRT